MQYLARKIGRRGAEIWTPTNYTGDSGVRADALAQEFGTKNDTLSLWQCDNNPQDLEEVALAFATSMEELEKFWIVLIEKEFLE